MVCSVVLVVAGGLASDLGLEGKRFLQGTGSGEGGDSDLHVNEGRRKGGSGARKGDGGGGGEIAEWGGRRKCYNVSALVSIAGVQSGGGHRMSASHHHVAVFLHPVRVVRRSTTLSDNIVIVCILLSGSKSPYI